MIDFAPLGLKFVRKYMRQAKSLAEDNKSCLSRGIGVLVVRIYDNGQSRILGSGYNGPPAKTPHCDSREYLEEMVWPQITPEEKSQSLKNLGIDGGGKEQFLDKATNCGVCPRRLIGANSGTRLEICSCEHAERNSIYNAVDDLHGAWMFCWCPVSCFDCTKAIVQVGIKRVFFIIDDTYGDAYQAKRSLFLFNHAGIDIFIEKPEFYLE